MFVQRLRMNRREQEIAIAGLPADLDGLRIVQLTDIHMGPFLSVGELERAVEIANEMRPHIALVTGDLISFKGDPLDDCLDRLKRLRADAGCSGVWETMKFTPARKTTSRLRERCSECASCDKATAVALRHCAFEPGRRRLSTQDGCVSSRRGKLIEPDAFNVLLSHNPDVFPVAAKQGFQLTIAGHTHGGQVRVEILRQDLNIARFFTPYVDGLYRRDNAAAFVSRGIGTIGIPARLGAPPEVALLRLRRA
jgi:predicted MPP superfamily phosphohydrolase